MMDPPASFTIPEDTILNINLNQLVMDVDEGDALTTTIDPSEGFSIDVDPDTLCIDPEKAEQASLLWSFPSEDL